MPQVLTELWRKQLGDDWETTHKLLLHTPGNLTLTGYYPQLSNDNVEMKKVLLNERHLEMNKYFKDKQQWILQRRIGSSRWKRVSSLDFVK
ncbi:MAG: hypothetical protein PVS3B3_05630 [Ktedonobacteraceae bacterium]